MSVTWKLKEYIQIFLDVLLHQKGRGSIVVRANASRAEGLRFEPDSMPWLNTRSLFTQQQMVPGGNTGEIKVARKGTGHPTSHADGSA